MPARTAYTSAEIEACRDSCDALLAVWAANEVEDTTLESLVFVQAVVVLDAWFAHREHDLEGDDANPMNEVRVIAGSVVGNAGTLRVPDPIRWAPERTVLHFTPGDEVEMTADGFERLAAAYLAAIEHTYLAAGG